MSTTGDTKTLTTRGIASDDFRRVMGSFATGVTVVTIAKFMGKPYGFSANAFASVSLNPPEVLVCIDRKVTGHRYFATGRIFSVHILAAHQGNLCQRFVTKGIDRFHGLSVSSTPCGAPLIDGVLAVLECKVVNVFRAADHDIILAGVQWFTSEEGFPLIFHKGRFARLEPPLESAGLQ